MRIVDLSTTIESNHEITIEYVDHQRGAKQIEAMLGVPAKLLRDEEGWAVESFTRFGTHSSTHIDAPWHYNSRIDGEDACTVDELPLEWFYGRGVKLDFRELPDGHVISASEVRAELERIGHALRAGDIVLVNTAAGTRYGEADYLARGVGMGREATNYLTAMGVRTMG